MPEDSLVFPMALDRSDSLSPCCQATRFNGFLLPAPTWSVHVRTRTRPDATKALEERDTRSCKAFAAMPLEKDLHTYA